MGKRCRTNGGNAVDEANQVDTDGTEAEFEGDECVAVNESAVRAALFAAVEGGVDGSERILSCRPLVKLFFSPKSDTIQEGVTMTAREQSATLLGSIRSHKFHKGYARRFFAGMTSILKKVVDGEEYVPVSAYESDEDDEKEGGIGDYSSNSRGKSSTSIKNQKEIVPDEDSTEALMYMKACALSVNAYLDGLFDRRSENDPPGKEYDVIDEAFAVGELLHDVLFSLQSYCGAEGLQVQTVVASLCEKWWHKHFIDRDYMVVQLIPFLVVRSLDGSAQKSDVKRLFMMRDAFQLLDFEEKTIAYLHSLILRTVSSPLFLHMVEGRRLVAYLFGLHASLVRDLHKAIRVQIPEAKKTILESYGDIYFRAWKESEPDSPVQSSIEEVALQDLMFAVLHVATPTMAKSLHTVLKPFHDAKKSQDVEKLLYRMYGPILWRSLKAANPRVRTNALDVLAETFPLQDPASGHMQLDKSVAKGTAALERSLSDSDPKVRIAGSSATAKILATFWDVLPTADIRVLLNHIIAKLSSDASSSAVRAAAINSVTVLLDAPQSHAVLRALLPTLGNLIHDKVERVRLAVARMLLRIKMIRGIKYYHVVPVDHLIARLAEEGRSPRNPQGPVTSALTSLMLNSYFPQGENVSGADQIKRTLSFLTTYPDAASVFYSNVATHLSINSVSKLAAMLLRCLSAAVETDKVESAKEKKNAKGGKKRRRYGSQQMEEEPSAGHATKESNGDGALTAANTPLMALLAETICTLWDSIEEELKDPRNEACNDFLLEAFSGVVLTDAHAHFERKAVKSDVSSETELRVQDDCYRACTAILRCAGRMPPKSVEGMSSHIANKLIAFERSSERESVRENVSPHIALLCLWGLTEDVAKSLSSSIEAALSDGKELAENSFERVVISSNKRKSTRSTLATQDLSVPLLPPQIALAVLCDILSGPDPSSIAARSIIIQSASACGLLEQALERATVFAEKIMLADPDMEEMIGCSNIPFVLKACEAYGKLALHKEASTNGPLFLSAQAKTLLSWVTEKVVPVIVSYNQANGNPLRDLNISRISSATDTPIPPCSPTPTEPPRQRKNRNSTPLKFDASFDSIGRYDVLTTIASEDDPSILRARAAAFSLINSSCFLFSEWLAVGGQVGVEEIAASASKWCQVLSFAPTTFAAQKELLPAFCRLAAQLCLKNRNFKLLKALIVNCDELQEDDEDNLLRKTVASVLSGRDMNGSSLITVVVDTVLVALYELLERSPTNEDETYQLPLTDDDVWGGEKGSFKSALSAIISNEQASLILGERLVENLGRHKHDGLHRIPLFEAKCIWMLCERRPGRVGNELKNALRKLDADEYESNMKTLLREILDGFA